MENQNQNKEVNKVAGMIFVGFMFVGIAAGMFFGKVPIGTLAGMGAGFIASAIYRSEKNK
jgi:hypothetical protein